MRDVFIASAVRTPIGNFGGSLATMSAADLGVAVVQEALSRSEIEAGAVEEVIVGHARQAGNGPNLARQISYRSGIPHEVSAYTVNKACGSGLKAIMLAANEIRLGNAGVVVAAGTESMSRVPFLVEARWGLRQGHQQLTDGMYRDGFMCPLSGMLMGDTAERLASIYKISRDEQDEYAAESQHRAACATRSGRFRAEILGIEVATKGVTRHFDTDEHVRMDVSLDEIKRRPPVFCATGTITAANSSGVTDGAAAVVLISEDEAKRRKIRPLARIVDYAVTGVDPRIMGIGPVAAIKKLLAKTGRALKEFGLIELNEAFAAQVLACLAEAPIDRDKLNVNGGAIALGHPIGCTGVRIVTTLIYEMHKRHVRYGLATLCISGGMGIAFAVESS